MDFIESFSNQSLGVHLYLIDFWIQRDRRSKSISANSNLSATVSSVDTEHKIWCGSVLSKHLLIKQDNR